MELLLKCRVIGTAQCLHQARGCGVRWRNGRFTGNVIGPLGALVDPRLDDVDLLRAQRSGRRHAQPELVSDQPLVQPAAGAVSRPDHGNRAASHGVAPPVQPEAVHLLSRPMAADAVGFEDRLNVATEVNLARTLRIESHRGCTEVENRAGNAPLEHISPSKRSEPPGNSSIGGLSVASPVHPRSSARKRQGPEDDMGGQVIARNFGASWRRGWDSNPRLSFPNTRFPSVLLKPLGHLSEKCSLG